MVKLFVIYCHKRVLGSVHSVDRKRTQRERNDLIDCIDAHTTQDQKNVAVFLQIFCVCVMFLLQSDLGFLKF